MTIHNLESEANILFASDSIVDILGYQANEVLGKSCFDYFHPDEVPFARSVHSKGVLLDKAAVLHYMRILSRDGQWVSCECCFTVVHDVLVACTSIYQRSEKSERRALEAPQIRRLFSSSPRDPRYHMLEHLSPKFKMPPMEREPRAALILNRFTRTLTVMFATNAVASILGVRPDQVKGKSFYECIAENCLPDAIKCLESAKANDSIAYLRFWYRDPRREEDFDEEDDDDESSDSDGGAQLAEPMDIDQGGAADPEIKAEPMSPPPFRASTMLQAAHSTFSSSSNQDSATSGSQSYHTPLTDPSPSGTNLPPPPRVPQHQQQRRRASPTPGPQDANRRRRGEPLPTCELEAVVSCTSDGLVVVLRKARPVIPNISPPMANPSFENGLFAAPWGARPINPYYPPEQFYHFRPPLMPQYMPVQEHVKAAGGPPIDQLMRSIRDVAVFAWALVGINGNLANYGHGVPQGEAQPPDGLPIWDPSSKDSSYPPPENQAARRWAQMDDRPMQPEDQSAAPYLSPRFHTEASRVYGQGSVPYSPTGQHSAFTFTASWSHSTTDSYTPAYPAFSHHQQSMQPGPPSYHDSQMREVWMDGADNYAQSQQQQNQHHHYHQNHNIQQQQSSQDAAPTTQPPGPGEGPHGHGYRW